MAEGCIEATASEKVHERRGKKFQNLFFQAEGR